MDQNNLENAQREKIINIYIELNKRPNDPLTDKEYARCYNAIFTANKLLKLQGDIYIGDLGYQISQIVKKKDVMSQKRINYAFARFKNIQDILRKIRNKKTRKRTIFVKGKRIKKL